jgi:SAM-dependent methyltransferase
MEFNEAMTFLSGVVKDFPFPENEYEAGYLRKHMVRYRDFCEIIAANCPADGRLLSIGCEPGHVEILLKKFYGFRQVAGLSYRASPEFKRRMAEFDIPMLECDVENQPIPDADGSFRSVVFLEALEHMFNGVPYALSEMQRVLAPGGVIVLSTPNLAQFRNRIKLLQGKSVNWPLDGAKRFFAKPVHMRHNREYTAKEVCFLLREAGFEVKGVQYGEYSPTRLMRVFNSLSPAFKSTIFVTAHRR